MLKKNSISRVVFLATVLGAFKAFGAAGVPIVDPWLQEFANLGKKNDRATVIVMLDSKACKLALPRKYDRVGVPRYLRSCMDSLVKMLDASITQARLSKDVFLKRKEAFWINFSVVMEVNAQGIGFLTQLPLVTSLTSTKRKIRLDRPIVGEMGLTAPIESYGFENSGMKKLWQMDPSISGKGVDMGHIDTGADGKHLELKGKIKSFYQVKVGRKAEPVDDEGHGTHTLGTILGGERKNAIVGIAHEANGVVAGSIFSGFAAMLEMMQAILDPDGNPQTADQPRAVSNSWNCEGAPDLQLFYRAIEAWEASGVLPIFSAGNAGPDPESITQPHEHPSVIAVAAHNKANQIAYFSSRGPGKFNGKDTQKPDLSAPGVNVISTTRGGQFGELSGTSMAAPHVAGATAIIWQVFPKATVAQVREILLGSTVAVDEKGNKISERKWNPTFGMGRLNIFDAAKLATERRISSEGFSQTVLRFEGIVVPESYFSF